MSTFVMSTFVVAINISAIFVEHWMDWSLVYYIVNIEPREISHINL